MSIKKILYFKYVSIVLLYDRYSFALFLNMFNHVSVVFKIMTSIDIADINPVAVTWLSPLQILILSLTLNSCFY